ncbi:hypothetical protein SFOMI_0675 [Sphingobium fuliginis]|uniref:Uncharacterized protein n=1 Tax=Sphingobium fuliginis (strain ATCC 27551) TaxID=336203 RepID=A0A292ZBE3_SPHSA|nr:hypothetical protein SFOMI_0675 [Sphingobium fuliginis]
MAHDAGILKQPFDIGFGESRDLAEIEAGKGGAEILALGEDGAPRQADWKPSRLSFSNRRRSSSIGKPHSWS